MKFLYLHYLNLQVCLLRRRLRRMGFVEVAARMNRQVFHPSDGNDYGFRLFLECVKIILAFAGLLSLWLMFLLNKFPLAQSL